jgi:NAD(P)-dependent dehydrogenase (short-subunit alcohol dehydrogenase family)
MEDSMKYLIIGAGGIGSALASHLHAQGEEVMTISRHASVDHVYGVKADPTDEKAMALAIDQLPAMPDVIISTVGFLHDGDYQPEKSLQAVSGMSVQQAMSVNVLPIVHVLKPLLKKMSRTCSLKVIAFSARVSSISDNQLGGWHSYRMSKCALNMLIKNIAIEWARDFKQAMIVGYHPGTVATKLSEPYAGHIAQDKMFTPERAAKDCLTWIEQLTTVHSGKLYDYHGEEIIP